MPREHPAARPTQRRELPALRGPEALERPADVDGRRSRNERVEPRHRAAADRRRRPQQLSVARADGVVAPDGAYEEPLRSPGDVQEPEVILDARLTVRVQT